MPADFAFRAKVWLYSGDGGWHFITLPVKISSEINALFKSQKRSFGSLPVEVKVGHTKWNTSIFPDKKSGSYLLPVKAQVRKAEKIDLDDVVELRLRIRV